MKGIDTRYISSPVELRQDGEGGGAHVVGYAAVFNERSVNLGGFTEIIEPGAFDEVMQDDVRALFNHDPNEVIGRVSANTLQIAVDSRGLRYDIALPESAGKLAESIARGDVSESSFSFRVAEDDWEENPDTGAVTRRIQSFAELRDVGPVTFAAYPQTSAAKRSLDAWHEGQDTYEREMRQRAAESRSRELFFLRNL